MKSEGKRDGIPNPNWEHGGRLSSTREVLESIYYTVSLFLFAYASICPIAKGLSSTRVCKLGARLGIFVKVLEKKSKIIWNSGCTAGSIAVDVDGALTKGIRFLSQL